MVSGNVTLHLMNGAKVATGNRGESAIRSISRVTANSANQRLDLAALGARSSETATTETVFVPNSFVAGDTVVLKGLSHRKDGTFVVTSDGANAKAVYRQHHRRDGKNVSS